MSCFRNACQHYGLPLSQGRIIGDQIQCGFHGWQYDLSTGELVKVPYLKTLPACRLKSYKTFTRGGIVFVYSGDEEYFENAKRFIMDDVFENPASIWMTYESSILFGNE